MNKRLFFKMSLATLPVLALFSQPVSAEENIHFSSCKKAWANGYSDIHEGEPGYSAKLDRDHDGVACELKNAPKGAFKAKQSTVAQTNTSSATTSGWVKQDGSWYYFDGNGNPVKNAWQGSYYLKADGKMATSKWVDNYKYYVDGSGKWVPGKVKKSGWVKEGGYWYFYLEGEELLRNNWKGNYYLGADGKMATENWVDNHKYYVDKNGAWVPNRVKSAWEKIDGIWYYYENGQPVKNVWKGNYYLQEDGTMATNKWVEDYRYYVGADGYWVKDKKLKN